MEDSTAKIPIAIVDDKPLFRSTLAEQLTYSGEIDILFEASNGQEFLYKMEELTKENFPSVVLMDIKMPVLDGIAAVASASKIYKNTAFLMFTFFDDDNKIVEAIKAGACGYILKEDKTSNLIDAIRYITKNGGVPLSPKVSHKIIDFIKNTTPHEQEDITEYGLSSRELDILICISEGLSHVQTGKKLAISPHTVRKHISNIYKKLHVSNRVSAINIAIKKKWI